MKKRLYLIITLNLLYMFWVAVIVTGAQSSACAAGEWFIDGACTVVESSLDDGWHTIEPGGETSCAHNTDYRFWVRPGNDDVLLYFQGGGGCWNQETCQNGSTFYKQQAGRNEAARYSTGIFDFDNPDNPFADHTVVFAPSCTGDVYMGGGVSDYGEDVVVHHRGFDNLKAAVDFTIDYAPDPDSVFVAGCSAGSVGSAIAIPFIIEAYPDIPVTQLGDSLGTIFDTVTDMSSLWNVPDFYTESLSEFAPDLGEFSLADYYIGLGQAYPEYTFAQFNYQFDNVQQRYFAFSEDDPATFISDSLHTSLTTIANTIPNFRYFLADGSTHCILPTARLYTTEFDDISALDWIAAIARGEMVENVLAR